MLITSPFFIFCSSLVLLLAIFVILYRQKSQYTHLYKALQSNSEAQALLLNELQASLKTLNNELLSYKEFNKVQQLETEQVTKQLEHRIKVLQQESSSQKQSLDQINSQQPQDKLYSRAFKLVELGADIDEIVRECDIPRAEAEMLMSVHKNKTSPS